MKTIKITKAINKVRDELAHVMSQRAIMEKNNKLQTQLKKAGMLPGKIVCKDKKYFVFVGQMVKGKRTRKQLGNGKTAASKKLIKKYREQIKNAEQYRQAEKQNKQISEWVTKTYFPYG